MGRILSHGSGRGLEGLCDGARFRIGRGSNGIERLEASLVGEAYAPHRHDTYAIGITLAGVQTFAYRGAERHCLPGQCHVLHPDEVHDGRAGTARGFRYRIAYIDPALVQASLGGRPLPFVPNPVVERNLASLFPTALWRLDDPIGDVAEVELVAAVADALEEMRGNRAERNRALPLAALSRIRDLLAADPAAPRSIDSLETVSGLDRWTLARGFRAAFGTSPTNFRTMRRLDRARRMIGAGTKLADAALAAGFADQSHMSRLFKRRYGITPGKWAAALV